MNCPYQEELDSFCEDDTCTSALGAMAACLQGLMADVLGADQQQQPDPTVAETMAELDKVPEALNSTCKCPYPPSEECMMGTGARSVDSAADAVAVGDSGAGRGESPDESCAKQGFMPLQLHRRRIRRSTSVILSVKHARGFQRLRAHTCIQKLHMRSSKCSRLFKLGDASILHAYISHIGDAHCLTLVLPLPVLQGLSQVSSPWQSLYWPLPHQPISPCCSDLRDYVRDMFP